MKSFKQHTIDDMIYAHPTDKDKERMLIVSEMFSIRADEIDIPAPPANSSPATMKDLLEVKSAVEKAEFEDYNKYDKEFTDDFHAITKEADAGISLEKIQSLSREVGRIAHYFKFKFNRPRPHQLADVLGVEIKHQATVSGTTPSYPSGHAAQGRFLALYLSSRLPKYKDEFMNLADRVSFSRVQGGVHYPSDSVTGNKLADILIENHNEDI